MCEITVVGLGLEEKQLTMEAAHALLSGRGVILRTGRCGAASYLAREGVPFDTLDALYENTEDFDDLAGALCAEVTRRAAKEDVVYGVLDIRDESVSRLLEGVHPVKIIPGVPLEGALFGRCMNPCACLAAADWAAYQPEAASGALIREIASRELASEVKLRLMERYPAEAEIIILTPEAGARNIALCELDRLPAYDHRVCAFVPAHRDLQKLDAYGFDELNRIMRILRSPQGCPWDRAQTHESIRQNVVEEAWEVADAIAQGDPDALCEELGDLLLQVTLQAEIARAHGEFTIDDVTGAICRKMIRRHPHVFGGAQVTGGADAGEVWDAVKRREKGGISVETAVKGAGRGEPALLRAEKVLLKAEKAGVSCPASPDSPDVGERLLALVKEAAHGGVHPEMALSDAINRFLDAFPQEITKFP